MKKAMIGYQVYSAREDAQKDLFSVMKQLKAMGYDGIELAGLYEYTAEEVRKMADDAGLVIISSHYPWAEIEKDMYKAISMHLTLGVKYIAIPYMEEYYRAGNAGFSGTLQAFAKFGRLCKEAGITLLYHNHDFEFTKVSGEYGLDFMYNAIPAEYLKTELDTCWVKYSGEDPAAYVRKYAGRCPVVHLKDFVGVKGGKQPYDLLQAGGEGEGADKDAQVEFTFRPVGYGSQDVKSILDAGLESGAEWFIVEQDLSPDRPALEAAKMSIGTLKNLGL